MNSPDEDFDKAAPTIEHSKSLCDRVETAERNIDRLYAIEHADATVRKKSSMSCEKTSLKRAQTTRAALLMKQTVWKRWPTPSTSLRPTSWINI